MKKVLSLIVAAVLMLAYIPDINAQEYGKSMVMGIQWDNIEGKYKVESIDDLEVLKIDCSKDISNKAVFEKNIKLYDEDRNPQCIEFSMRIKTDGQSIRLVLGEEGSPEYIRPFTVAENIISCIDIPSMQIDADKWVNFKVKMDFKNNIIDLYLRHTNSHSTIMYKEFEKIELPETLTFKLEFEVEASKTIFADSISINNVDGFEKQYLSPKLENTLLEKYENVHPRIFAGNDDFDRIRKLVLKEEYAPEWNSLLEQADKLVSDGIREYTEEKNTEETWMRDEADAVMNLCLVAKVTGDEKYRDALRKVMKTALSYPQWGRAEFYNNSLPCAHMLLLCSIYYDWFYDDLTNEEKEEIISVVEERGEIMSKLSWWKDSYLQNHSWVAAAALMSAACAFYEEIPQTQQWATIAKNLYDKIFYYLPDSGATHEGMMYWNYGVRFVEYYVILAEELFGLDYTSNEFMKNTLNFFEAMLLPEKTEKLSDFRFSDFSMKIEPITVATVEYLANRNDDAVAKWYVDYMRKNIPQSEKYFYGAWYLLYNDEMVKTISPVEGGLNTISYFEDLGYLFVRDNWTESQTAIAYRCGSALGTKVVNDIGKGELGTGHIHNDINSPQIFTRNRNLLAETVYGGKATESHNTILVNGKGQFTDDAPNNGFSKVYPKGIIVEPKIEKIEEGSDYVYSVADASLMYDDEETGLKLWKRHFLYLKPDILLITDEIMTEDRDESIPVEIRYFPEEQNYVISKDTGFLFSNPDYNFSIKPLDTENATREAVRITKKLNSNNTSEQTLVRIISEDEHLIQPVAFSWSDPDKEPAIINAKKCGKEKVEFYIDNEIITLDIKNMTVIEETVDKKTIVYVDDELKRPVEKELILKNDRFFANAEMFYNYFGITVNEDKINERYILSGFGKSVYVPYGSDTVIQNGENNIKMDVLPFVEENEAFLPVRFVLQAFGNDCNYNPEKGVLKVMSGIDFSDASLSSLNINGISVALNESNNYELRIFKNELEVDAIPSVVSAVTTIIKPKDVYGDIVIEVTSADKSNKRIYTVKTIPYYDVCGTVLCQFGISSSDSNVGENAFDGNLNSRWSAQGEGQYIWYDLGEEKNIDSVKVAMYLGDKRTTEFDIEVSNDNDTYFNVGHFISSGETIELEEYKLTEAKGRYIRLVGYGAKGSGWNSITEFGVVLK